MTPHFGGPQFIKLDNIVKLFDWNDEFLRNDLKSTLWGHNGLDLWAQNFNQCMLTTMWMVVEKQPQDWLRYCLEWYGCQKIFWHYNIMVFHSVILSDSSLKCSIRIFIIDYHRNIHDMILCCIYVYCQLVVNGTTANKGHNLLDMPHQIPMLWAHTVWVWMHEHCLCIQHCVCVIWDLFCLERNHDLSLGMTDMDILGRYWFHI